MTLGKEGEPAREVADRLYGELLEAGVDVVYDDREASAGEKFADAELLGVPLRLVAGRRGLADGVIEAQERRSGTDRRLPLDSAAEEALKLLEGLE